MGLYGTWMNSDNDLTSYYDPARMMKHEEKRVKVLMVLEHFLWENVCFFSIWPLEALGPRMAHRDELEKWFQFSVADSALTQYVMLY